MDFRYDGFVSQIWECDAMPFSDSDVLLFTEPYLLQLSAVDSSDGRNSCSDGLLLSRPVFLYLFRRLWVSWKRIVKEDSLCSLLAFEQICLAVQVAHWVSDLVARDFFGGNCSSGRRMLVLEAERVTPVSLISLLGSVSRYEPSGSSELNLLYLPSFRNRKDPLEDFDYNDPRCNPLLRPVAARTPSINHLIICPQAV
ncbi:hypothetical protein F511_24584 [Dorcoceras hygrometricum]|uniref:Uncharacterized protein n=1 Tax=Dorcoceras hygrometricum TaxID=472368 RepID=A0A2Z7DFP0_9LAMI|nr:hypothetical protein F511_24584 [Dorcoceras hygrometricum]